jgi:hypothetical protein
MCFDGKAIAHYLFTLLNSKTVSAEPAHYRDISVESAVLLHPSFSGIDCPQTLPLSHSSTRGRMVPDNLCKPNSCPP